MDFAFTPQQERFRKEIRAFLAREMPPGWRGRAFIWMSEEEWRVARAFDRKLGAQGLLTLAWPKAYGGQDRSAIEQLVFQEEMAYQRAPNGGGWAHGPVFVGPTIMHYGNEAMKRQFLPPISRGEVIWCQGCSEPRAGSDLASLETEAVRVGDDYVVTGVKHLVGQGHRADWCILAARTDPRAPKHKGVSLLLVDMRAPGVRTELMPTLPEHGAQTRIILERVRVPKDRLVGEENRGFYQMMTTMDLERNRIAQAAEAARFVDDLWAYARSAGILRSLAARRRLAERRIETRIAILLNYRIAWLQEQGQIPNAEASTAKLLTEETRQRVAATGVQVLGLAGQLGMGERRAPGGGQWQDYYLAMVSATLVGGSSEVQRNIIAQRGLGLPR
jgi:alkylation response protein AidB-like acyl-CoA dehydrogenase